MRLTSDFLTTLYWHVCDKSRKPFLGDSLDDLWLLAIENRTEAEWNEWLHVYLKYFWLIYDNKC